MAQIDRFTVSLDTELLAAFDRHLAAKGYDNRSEAIRDMIRDLLVTSRVQRGDDQVAAVLSIACDHRVGEAAKRFRVLLANHPDLIHGSVSVPIDEHRDSIAVMLKGPLGKVQALANEIQAMRGLTHGHLSIVPAHE